jgi:23S rRNA (adenine2503-C2)-methyltransferase
VAAANIFSKYKNRAVTFEYVVIDKENDSYSAAKELIRLLKKINCKINLIPLNPYADSSLKEPDNTNLNLFAKKLADGGLTVTVRHSKGRDISGACGQLAGKGN